MKTENKYSILEIGTAFSVFVLILAGLYALYNHNWFEFIFFCSLSVILLSVTAITLKKDKKNINDYVKMLTARCEGISTDAISRFPLPMLVLQIDGQIIWFNESFSEMLSVENLYGSKIGNLMPELRWSDILKSSGNINVNVDYKDKNYNVLGDIIKNENSTEEQPDYTVLLYFIDRTEINTLKFRHDNERTDIAIINIDNYDEIFQNMDDSEAQKLIAEINKCLVAWVSESGGVLKKTERDRYLMLFEHEHLNNYIQNKFDIVKNVRTLGEESKLPVAVSIGIGVGGSIIENDENARAAINMALGRGGDQAVIKDLSQYSFYAGITKDYEKSTRVKTRAFSVAFKEFIKNSDKVIFIAHSGMDYDAFGSAIGLQRAVRLLGKSPYVIYDGSPAVDALISEAKNIEEYNGMFITPNDAEAIITKDTLLVIVDTHRESLLPNSNLLDKTENKVLIDHHRRSTDFISGISLVYHEPYASSTCEIATEILQYIDTNKKFLPFEAKSLYIGILTDTKNFTIKTGVRTFESASYLKRYGLNTMEARKIFNSNRQDYINRSEIIKNSKVINENMLVSLCDETYPNMRVISSQAADEMLNLRGITAAFVLYHGENNEICLSARSLGDINVQLIAEKLGGGGHSTIAGAQLKNTTLDDAMNKLLKGIEDYMEENRKD